MKFQSRFYVAAHTNANVLEEYNLDILRTKEGGKRYMLDELLVTLSRISKRAIMWNISASKSHRDDSLLSAIAADRSAFRTLLIFSPKDLIVSQ